MKLHAENKSQRQRTESAMASCIFDKSQEIAVEAVQACGFAGLLNPLTINLTQSQALASSTATEGSKTEGAPLLVPLSLVLDTNWNGFLVCSRH